MHNKDLHRRTAKRVIISDFECAADKVHSDYLFKNRARKRLRYVDVDVMTLK